MRLLLPNSAEVSIRHIGLESFKTHFGLLSQPGNWGSGAKLSQYGVPWALDNGAFAGFDEARFWLMLDRYQGVPGCLFAVAPDVVCDARATLEQFWRWQMNIRAKGYPVAFVGQNGAEDMDLPWDLFDAFFIGGDTAWKLSSTAADLVKEAKHRGKHVHMGRVNSARRLRYARSIGCDTCDGTGYARFPMRTREALVTLRADQHPLFTF